MKTRLGSIPITTTTNHKPTTTMTTMTTTITPALQRWIGQLVYVYLPYGVCYRGVLRVKVDDNTMYSVVLEGTRANFHASDVIMLNMSGNHALWLKGSTPPKPCSYLKAVLPDGSWAH